jgi:SAM-dependent methyltransferase
MNETPPFSRSARIYDAVYAARGKDYPGEARRIRRLAGGRRRSLTLLDVGCGTGEHLRALTGLGSAVGLDADPAMLGVARAKLPRAHLVRADMRRFTLRRRFDLVTCLFASIGYLPDRQAVCEAVAAMAQCLAPDGLLLMEPPLTSDQLAPAQESELTFDHEGWSIERRTSARHELARLRIRFDYTMRRGTRVERFSEIHAIQTLPLDAYLRAFERAGLTADRDASWPSLGGLLIGRQARGAGGTTGRGSHTPRRPARLRVD